MMTKTRTVIASPRYKLLQQVCLQLHLPLDSLITTLSRFFRRKLKFLESYFRVLSLELPPLVLALLPTKWKSLSVSSPENVGEVDFRSGARLYVPPPARRDPVLGQKYLALVDKNI